MIKKIYLAGGCFWGVEEYMSRINGVKDCIVGYANGKTDITDYQKVGDTGHAETVAVSYDNDEISLYDLLQYYFRAVNPVTLNRQGPDLGIQYRTGIYYTDDEDVAVIKKALDELQEEYPVPIMIEDKKLENFVIAEDYHQDYLKKHPEASCHIDLGKANEVVIPRNSYKKNLSKLDELQLAVTQEGETEPAFKNEYVKNKRKGIYVDIASGEPLFLSTDKFESGCGWPSFAKPIASDVVKYKEDYSDYMARIEVKSRIADSHLGHVFNDGPEELGGLRYCINSASLRFVPYEDMEKEGYEYLMDLVK